jgi:CelD/BcsL family acetyltransferase involved in cellulose biosynthesis
LKIQAIDPISDARWDAYVQNHPGGTIFHHSAWARVLQERYGTKPTYFAGENGGGEITAVAPFFKIPSPLGGRRLVCLPCSEYCFPLADDPGDAAELTRHALEQVKDQHLSYLEIRGIQSQASAVGLDLKEHPYFLSHVSSLEGDIQQFRSRLSKETRYHISRGERSPVTVRIGDGEEDLKAFHRLMAGMRRHARLLPLPYRFFRSIYRHIIQPGLGFLLVAEVEGKIVSGGLFFCFKDTVINKFNASDARYIQLRTAYMIMWKAIERAFGQAYRFFDFGITNPDNTGLINFKKHWNSRETIIPYYYYPQVRGVTSLSETDLISRAHDAFNQVVPDFLLRMTASLLYKRLG